MWESIVWFLYCLIQLCVLKFKEASESRLPSIWFVDSHQSSHRVIGMYSILRLDSEIYAQVQRIHHLPTTFLDCIQHVFIRTLRRSERRNLCRGTRLSHYRLLLQVTYFTWFVLFIDCSTTYVTHECTSKVNRIFIICIRLKDSGDSASKCHPSNAAESFVWKENKRSRYSY